MPRPSVPLKIEAHSMLWDLNPAFIDRVSDKMFDRAVHIEVEATQSLPHTRFPALMELAAQFYSLAGDAAMIAHRTSPNDERSQYHKDRALVMYAKADKLLEDARS